MGGEDCVGLTDRRAPASLATPQHSPAKKGPCVCSFMMAMKKAATCFWCGYCTLRAVKPVRHCGRTAIICDSCYLQEKRWQLPKIDPPKSLRMRKRWATKAYDAGRPARRFAGGLVVFGLAKVRDWCAPVAARAGAAAHGLLSSRLRAAYRNTLLRST